VVRLRGDGADPVRGLGRSESGAEGELLETPGIRAR
jgi:hypothetical protein